MKKSIHFIGLALVISQGYAGTMGPVQSYEPSNYLSAFGGGGSLSSLSFAQLGTAFYPDAAGGPLAVNAFGHSDSRSEWMVGGNIGHFFAETTIPFLSQWSFKPAAEIEGFYIGRNTLTGHDINNDTARLVEHNFSVAYPMDVGGGLINAIAYFQHTSFPELQPYVGGGIGAGLVSLKNANSLQTAPLEVGINHYNSDPSDSDTAFVSQLKVGLGYNFNAHWSIFGEYRYIYVSSTDFTLGSTVYPTHVATSNWNVKLGSQEYNMGVAGIRCVF